MDETWMPTEDKNLASGYHNLNTNIVRHGTGANFGIELSIPYTTSNVTHEHQQIIILPFRMYKKNTILEVKSPGEGTVFHTIKIDENYFLLDTAKISSNWENKELDSLAKGELTRIEGRDKQCIRAIESNALNEITKACKMIESDKKMVMHEIDVGEFIYFTEKPENITTSCQILKNGTETELVTKKWTIEDIGNFSAPPSCLVKTSRKIFFTKSRLRRVHLENFMEPMATTINDFTMFNPEVWRMALDNRKFTIKELEQAKKDLVTIQKRFKDHEKLKPLTTKLMSEITENLEDAKESEKVTYKLLKMIQKPTNIVSLTVGVIILAGIIWTMQRACCKGGHKVTNRYKITDPYEGENLTEMWSMVSPLDDRTKAIGKLGKESKLI